jgi:hypothetical protein
MAVFKIALLDPGQKAVNLEILDGCRYLTKCQCIRSFCHGKTFVRFTVCC